MLPLNQLKDGVEVGIISQKFFRFLIPTELSPKQFGQLDIELTYICLSEVVHLRLAIEKKYIFTYLLFVFLWGVLGIWFRSLEFKIGSLESEKIFIGSLDTEKIGSIESENRVTTGQSWINYIISVQL